MSLLALDDVTASYGPAQALFGVSLHIDAGEVVALLGRNGMGKSTSVKVICRLLEASGGSVRFDGKDVSGLAAHRVARLGLGLVPEGRRCFAPLTVSENLTAAARPGEWTVETVTALFPRLGERMQQLAASLSGGEQQMLAIGRALLAKPKLMMLDEPSLGLSPILVRQLFALLQDLNRDGLTLLLVEQNTHMALRAASRGYVLELGRVSIAGSSAELARDERLQAAYLGG